MENQNKKYLFTSESVSEGHPDKVSDQISDAVLDFFLSKDPYARVAVETLTTTNTIVLAGEVKTNIDFTHEEVNHIAAGVVKDIGYDQPGFDYRRLNIINHMHEQSADIAQGVDETENKEEGAGDQGLMFGYATNETPDYMPVAIYYSNKLLQNLKEKRNKGEIKGLLPDAKTQITFEFEDGVATRVHTVVLSTQHDESLSLDEVRKLVMPVIKDTIPSHLYDPSTCLHHINPTGRFVIGGPDGDTGLTGRKIIVDTYGGSAPHGGGAFSGKDPTKVDRSAAYAARYLAKNIVAAEVADRCTIQISYAIGVAAPTSVYLDFHGTGKYSESEVLEVIYKIIDLKPKSIREHLNLNAPIYRRTSAYGHFGRKPEGGSFTWEKLDLVEKIKLLLK